MDQEETAYEVQENHSLARGIQGGLVIALLAGALAAYNGFPALVGVGGAVVASILITFLRYKG